MSDENQGYYGTLSDTTAANLIQGTAAKSVFLDDVVECAFGVNVNDQISACEVLGSRFYHVLAAEIALRILACGEAIPVVTGMRNDLYTKFKEEH